MKCSCRKKMKRVERRGTIDQAAALLQQSQAQAQAQAAASVHHTNSLSAATSLSGHPNRPSPPQRQDTIIAEESQRSDRDRGGTQMLSPQSTRHSHSGHSGHHARQSDSRSRSPVPDISRGHPQGSSSAAPPSNGSNRPASHRRPPTPPYITSLSSRDQERTGYPNSTGATNGAPRGGSGSRSSSLGDEHDDLLALAEGDGDGDGDGERDEIDADVDGDLDVDAEIARTLPSGSPPNTKHHHPQQNGSPVKILVNGSNVSGNATTTSRGGNSGSYANGNGVAHHGYGHGRDPVHDKLSSSRSTVVTAADALMDVEDEEADADAEVDPDADIIDAVDAAANGRMKEED